MAVDPKSQDYADAVARHWGRSASTIRAFWQSRVVMGEVNRRITGDSQLRPYEYFKATYCPTPRQSGLSLGSGGGQLETALVSVGAVTKMLGVDLAHERVEQANAQVPDTLRDRVTFVAENLEVWRPDGHYDLIVSKGILHHLADLEGWCRRFADLLTADGLIYFDDFVGPTRFQWTDKQLEIINRLLDRLSPEMRRDLVLADGRSRPAVGRPNVDRFIADDPSEAIRSSEILAVLEDHFETVELRPYGGALYHQFFNRIMGNFAGHDDLVRMIMEFDAILTDEGVLETNYVWGVFRPRRAREAG